MKESNLIKTFLPEWQEKNGKDSYLCRNNTGSAWQGEVQSEGSDFITIKRPRLITFGIGLMKKIKRKWRPVGGGDLIGWTSKTICEILIEADSNFTKENCPGYKTACDVCISKQKIAIFTSIEAKTKGMKETKEQIDWKNKVKNAGGIVEVVKE